MEYSQYLKNFINNQLPGLIHNYEPISKFSFNLSLPVSNPETPNPLHRRRQLFSASRKGYYTVQDNKNRAFRIQDIDSDRLEIDFD
ncbi:hypothetical protein SS50377_20044 [Spironucleus salmonicida]|uniref:Uncharacterized protein n=1 Tax=Spironucleus salmonicida TaxID=348837 RepID=V6LXM7_9EUKA|nr:hypothetical protein SS50377_20044 [Spironucleus salmonicida]|eukprot:EST49387.1 Hypothetical protein SS50377_10312 [Spironucleus salmonicida]